MCLCVLSLLIGTRKKRDETQNDDALIDSCFVMFLFCYLVG
jgi:hypothetical protein